MHSYERAPSSLSNACFNRPHMMKTVYTVIVVMHSIIGSRLTVCFLCFTESYFVFSCTALCLLLFAVSQLYNCALW